MGKRGARIMSNYYADNLNALNLYRVYETNIDRVKQYFNAEVDCVKESLSGREKVLELGAGYGRIMKDLAPHALSVTGIDISDVKMVLWRRHIPMRICSGWEMRSVIRTKFLKKTNP